MEKLRFIGILAYPKMYISEKLESDDITFLVVFSVLKETQTFDIAQGKLSIHYNWCSSEP